MEQKIINPAGALHGSVQSMNEKVAHSAAPVSDLAGCLSLHTRERLSELAKVLSVPKSSKMKKGELVLEIAKKLTDISMLSSILTEADEKEFELFTAAAEKGAVKFGSGELVPFQALHFLGIAAAFLTPGVITIIVPDEIKQTWDELKKTGFTEKKLRSEIIHKYATASVNLYGAISFAALITQIRRYEGAEMEEEVVRDVILSHMSRNQPYYVWNDYVVNALFGDAEESLETLIDAAVDVPRYAPERDEFIKYAAPVFYEEIPQNNAVAGLLTGVVGDSHVAGVLMGELRIMFASGIPAGEGYRMLVNGGVNFRDPETMQMAVKLIEDMHREARLWKKRGHTVKEVEDIGVIGRNDRCPCDSGLKYKKCCAGR